MIIDVRARLPLRRRLGSDVCTAGLWGIFACLLLPTINSFGHARHHAVAAGISIPALNSVVSILALAIGAWLWMRTRQHRASAESQLAAPNYAQRFGLTETQLVQYRATQTCIVHHNEAGDIIRIDAPIAVAFVRDTPAEIPAAAMLPDAKPEYAFLATAA